MRKKDKQPTPDEARDDYIGVFGLEEDVRGEPRPPGHDEPEKE